MRATGRGSVEREIDRRLNSLRFLRRAINPRRLCSAAETVASLVHSNRRRSRRGSDRCAYLAVRKLYDWSLKGNTYRFSKYEMASPFENIGDRHDKLHFFFFHSSYPFLDFAHSCAMKFSSRRKFSRGTRRTRTRRRIY